MKTSTLTRAARRFLLVAAFGVALTSASAASAASSDSQKPVFKTLGAMIDVSRGRVFTVPYLKTRFEQMGKMGYNAVMLYTEETYKLEGVPKWGYMRGGYTKDDIKELKAAADANGLEFVPCIQTLGHLEKYLRWPDADAVKCHQSTLLVGEPKTYELIEKMVAFWQETVGGSRIHVGMDESVGFWGHEYEKRNGKRPRFDVFLEHLQKVCLNRRPRSRSSGASGRTRRSPHVRADSSPSPWCAKAPSASASW